MRGGSAFLSAGGAGRFEALGPWVAIALLGAVLAVGVRSTWSVVGKAAWLDHTHRVIESIDDLQLEVWGPSSRGVAMR